jgi:hypothetical protein
LWGKINMNLSLTVVDFQEARPIYPERDPKNPARIAALHPGRIRYSLILKLPTGEQAKVQVPAKFFDRCLEEAGLVEAGAPKLGIADYLKTIG